MLFDQKTIEFEKDRLMYICGQINSQLKAGSDAAANVKKNTINLQKSMWDHVNPTPKDLDDLANIWQFQTDLIREGSKTIFLSNQAAKLERMLKNPYFARIDFRENGYEQADRIYIGISNIKNEKTSEILVYDWRAPVCGMFYDFELGSAAYQCPAGKIEGEILLKRQYRIWNGEIQFMFDSSLAINDEVLQEILGKSVDSKMKTIVTSIQREQNNVIRNEFSKLLVVTGPAGSGKTSVALHRAAYLLYRYRESVTSENIAVFSPNNIFSDYISEVLPELGEENIQRTTFLEYAQRILGQEMLLEDHARQMEFLLCCENCCEKIASSDINGPGNKLRKIGEGEGDVSQQKFSGRELEGQGPGPGDVSQQRSGNLVLGDVLGDSPQYHDKISEYYNRIRNIRYKTSREIIQDIVKYSHFVEEQREFEDLYFNGKLIETGEEISQYFRMDLKFLPVTKRLEKIRSRLTAKLDILMKARIEEVVMEVAKTGEYPNPAEIRGRSIFIVRGEAEQAKKQIEKMTGLNLPECYKGFIRKKADQEYRSAESTVDGCQTVDVQGKRCIFYEDVAPMLLLSGLLSGFPDMSRIKHVIIDEVQDYSPVQFEIFKHLFKNSNITLLGDPNQAVNPYVSPFSIHSVFEILGNTASNLVNLNKSYRSTRQINEFCREIIGSNDTNDSINRDGELPVVFCFENQYEMYEAAAKDIRKMKEEGVKSIAVILRTEEDCNRAYRTLSQWMEIGFVTADRQKFFYGAAIIPSYLSKGLEFDAVLILCQDTKCFSNSNEVRLAYTICTRALHRLHVYCATGFPGFLDGVKKSCYRMLDERI